MFHSAFSMIGKTVSHYRIIDSLGSGGMGVVYSGEDIRLGRPVALKFVPEELAKDGVAVDRLKSEARTASGLNHANICTIYDIGEHEGQFFIVMELLQGHTLRERLSAGPLKPLEVIDLGIHVADALDAAHHRAIVHRDIKPANLFLVDRGPVKILDFGLAKLVPHSSETSTTAGLTRDRTAAGVTLGTVAYMSPEQVTGDDLDNRTDLFSLGVVLYEALTGQQPFTGKTSAVIFTAILTRAPVAPIVFNPEIPLRLQEVINNCLEKDRELRYQDAAGLRADLKRVRRDLESGQSGVFRISGSAPVAAWDHTRASVSHTTTHGSGGLPSHAVPKADSAPTETVAPSGAVAAAPKSKLSGIAAAMIAAAVVVGAALWFSSRPQSPSPSTQPPSASDSNRTPLALATASIQSKDYRAAVQYAEEALRLAPNDRDAARIRDAARDSLTRLDRAIAEANQRLAAGDANGAANALETARAIDPTASALNDLSTRITQLRHTQDAAQRDVPPSRVSAQSPPPLQGRSAASPAPRPEPRARSGAPSAPVPPPAVAQPQSEPSRPTPSQPETPPPAAPPEVAPPPPAPVRPTPPSEAPPRPTPPAPEPPLASLPGATTPSRAAESDDAAIRRVVATYARAIETKDLGLFRSVKPNMSADEQRRIEDGFRAVTSQQVSVVIVSVEQRGQEASVRLRRRDTILAGGRQQTSESLQTMTLTRGASGWVIREIGR